jgi:hypothetical protein
MQRRDFLTAGVAGARPYDDEKLGLVKVAK